MSSPVMNYPEEALTTLFNDLNSSHANLLHFGEDITNAGQQLGVAWEGDRAHADFHAVYSKWNQEYEQTLHVLNRIAAAVESALHRALGTDGKIGDGFGAA